MFENRLNEILVRDKFVDLENTAHLLEDEIMPIAKNYLQLSDQVVVRYRKEGDEFVFNIEIRAERIKPYGAYV